MMISQRTFVSFDEPCPYQCKHCYTYAIKREKIRTFEEIVDSISNDRFDVIYVSQKNDNFAEPLKGLELCYALFKRYNRNLFIITRNTFNQEEIEVLKNLKTEMQRYNKQIFIAISVNAIESINICENIKKVCTPHERIKFIKKLSKENLSPILMLRPIFPNQMIPINECLNIIEKTHQYVSCVVSSGLGINTDILNRLGKKEDDFLYSKNQEYLQGAIDCEIKFIDVDYEIKKISEKCRELDVPLFEHSMPALNYVASFSAKT